MQTSQINSHNIKTSRLVVFHNCNTKTAHKKFPVLILNSLSFTELINSQRFTSFHSCLQCFDTVEWWQEGHPARKKYGGMVEVGTG